MSDRLFRVTTASSASFMLSRISGHEQLGRPFDFEVSLLSKSREVSPAEVLGKPMVLHLPVSPTETRYFHGLVSQLSAEGMQGRHWLYRARMRPWLWFLSCTSNCRVFQNKTVPEIAKEIFSEHGFSDFDAASFAGDHRRWEYLVQYRESDFTFISRLFEQEGLYYYFEHSEAKHTLVLAGGGASPHKPGPGYERVRYAKQHDTDHLFEWHCAHHLQPGTYVLDDYYYEEPRRALQAGHDVRRDHEHHDFEVFDYPGEYETKAEGKRYAQVRLEELHSRYERWTGSGPVGGLGAGQVFRVYDYPEVGQTTEEYLIVEASYHFDAGQYESLGPKTHSGASCTLMAIPSATPFRPERSTPTPVIAGYQIATVVGKAGQEITTDQHGRVKIHFPWDRKGPTDEKSSCWVRVAHAWAGSGWGTLHVPRIGQEVLVSFLDGDPDRPLITGCVYNGVSKPPWSPVTGLISGTKSESTPGGGGYNEISLNDAKGKEQIVVHAQRDMNSVVEHDKTLEVRHDRTSSITNDDTLTVGRHRDESIGKHLKQKVGAGKEVEVTGDSSEKVSDNKLVEAGKNHTLVSHQQTKIMSMGELTIAGQKSGVIEMANELTIRVGLASIVLKKTGEITISGTNITIQGGASIALQSALIRQG